MPDPVVIARDHGRPSRPRPAAAPILLVLGAAAFAYLAIGQHGTVGPSAAPPVPELPAPEPAGRPGPLGEEVPGFEGRLVLLVEAEGRLALVNWSPHTPPRPTPTTPQFAQFLDYDPTLEWAGVILPTPEGPRLKLGLPGVFEPRWFLPSSRGITSFAWHRTRPGTLAWVAGAPGETAVLYRGRAPDLIYRQEEPVQVTRVPDGSLLRAWGDWGFVLTLGREHLRLLDPSGSPVAEHDELGVVTVGPRGDLLLAWSPPQGMAEAPGWLWADPTLSRVTTAGFVGWPLAWSGEGDRLAVLGSTPEEIRVGLREAGTDRLQQELAVAAPASGPVEGAGWTFDGFLVAHPGTGSELVVVDLDQGTATALAWAPASGTIRRIWVQQASASSEG